MDQLKVIASHLLRRATELIQQLGLEGRLIVRVEVSQDLGDAERRDIEVWEPNLEDSRLDRMVCYSVVASDGIDFHRNRRNFQNQPGFYSFAPDCNNIQVLRYEDPELLDRWERSLVEVILGWVNRGSGGGRV